MSFDDALLFTLSWEGGYVNDPDDPGGETKFGISKKSFPHEDIKNMTHERAAEIYRAGYWFDGLPEPLATAAFDTAVNVGRGRVKQWLGEVEHLDPVTGAKELLHLRGDHYAKIIRANPKLAKFAKGWAKRVESLAKHLGLGSLPDFTDVHGGSSSTAQP